MGAENRRQPKLVGRPRHQGEPAAHPAGDGFPRRKREGRILWVAPSRGRREKLAGRASAESECPGLTLFSFRSSWLSCSLVGPGASGREKAGRVGMEGAPCTVLCSGGRGRQELLGPGGPNPAPRSLQLFSDNHSRCLMVASQGPRTTVPLHGPHCARAGLLPAPVRCVCTQLPGASLTTGGQSAGCKGTARGPGCSSSVRRPGTVRRRPSSRYQEVSLHPQCPHNQHPEPPSATAREQATGREEERGCSSPVFVTCWTSGIPVPARVPH